MRLLYADMEQVFRRAVFNYLSGVYDDHDKNTSFIVSHIMEHAVRKSGTKQLA